MVSKIAARKTLIREPNESMRCITRFEAFKCWRVSLPKGLGGGQVYFSDSDYGGKEAALREARYYRDERFEEVGLPIMARVNITAVRMERGEVMPVYETTDQRGVQVVKGRWMETVKGRPKERTVQRSCSLHGAEDARRIVEAQVRLGIEREAARLAAAESQGLLKLGDGAVGSRRNRKAQ